MTTQAPVIPLDTSDKMKAAVKILNQLGGEVSLRVWFYILKKKPKPSV